MERERCSVTKTEKAEQVRLGWQMHRRRWPPAVVFVHEGLGGVRVRGYGLDGER